MSGSPAKLEASGTLGRRESGASPGLSRTGDTRVHRRPVSSQAHPTQRDPAAAVGEAPAQRTVGCAPGPHGHTIDNAHATVSIHTDEWLMSD
eukprot:2927520-Prymnesium_polylepis.1